MKEKRPISLIIFIFLLALFFSYHIYYYVQSEVNKEKVDRFLIQNDVVDNYIERKSEDYGVKKEEYLGILAIPKLNLEKGFYNVDSKNNNVNKNIELLKFSDMPDNNGGIIVFAAHRGNSYVSYFNNLYKLKLDDEINVYYKNKKYTYIVNNIYEEKKDGTINVNKNIHENYLVLTTCSKRSGKQLIVTSKLLKEE